MLLILPCTGITGDIDLNPHGELLLECNLCHTTDNWNDLRSDTAFDHYAQSGFQLYGGHNRVNCRECHSNLIFNETESSCVSCHTDIHEAQFGDACEECHLSRRWFDEPVFRTRHLETRFPLTGVHAHLNCQECHAEGNYTTLSNDCKDCHWESLISTSNPDHQAARFVHDCEECHVYDSGGWRSVTYMHSESFPLTLGHSLSDCNSCHQEGYDNIPIECFICHQEDFENVSDPDHVETGYPTVCEICHTTVEWEDTSFDHGLTEFLLDGAHSDLNCLECHQAGYNDTPTTCFSCHEDDFDNSSNPNHTAAGFSSECLLCHSSESWEQTTWSHDETGWILTGLHINLNCNECHLSDQYEGTPTTCFLCHEEDYNNTNDPDHNESGFPEDCEICHTTSSWEDALFDHSTSEFPLTGAHSDLDCLECHSEGYTDTPVACFSCHEDDYNNTSAPDHVAAGFSSSCELCHATISWEQTTWSHDETGWILTGSHIILSCSLCHLDNQYEGTPTACFFCHENDYNNTSDPPHQSIGIPLTCELCHNTVSWDEASFDHLIWFPIYTGSHNGEWVSCTDCHFDPLNYNLFSCIDCHAHNQIDMDDEHSDVTGYLYESLACYDCHPTGKAERYPLPQIRRIDPDLENLPIDRK